MHQSYVFKTRETFSKTLFTKTIHTKTIHTKSIHTKAIFTKSIYIHGPSFRWDSSLAWRGERGVHQMHGQSRRVSARASQNRKLHNFSKVLRRCFSLLIDDPHMHKNAYPYFRDIEITEVRYQVVIDIISISNLKIASTTIPVKQRFFLQSLHNAVNS